MDARVRPFARAETIAVGSEMLALGRVDTNSGVIADRLATLGIDVIARSVVGDHLGHLEIAVRTALQRADVVLITGGLGPTDDDLTRQAVAAALGREMHEDAVQMARITERFAKRALAMPEINRRQAMLIDGAVRLDNPYGTAPGQWIDLGPQAIALLPGPPREMGPMLDGLVAGALGGAGRRANAPTAVASRWRAGASRRWRRRCSRSMRRGGPRRCRSRRRSSRPSGASNCTCSCGPRMPLAAEATLSRAIAEAAAALGPSVYTTTDESLEDLAGRLLRAAGWRVSVAESCTGGMLGARLTDVPGSSAWVDGGVITYSNALKTVLADVPPALIAEHGAVSEPVALALAAGVRARCGTQVGIGITGIAGPDGGTDAKPVGTVFIALHTPAIVACRHARFVGDRAVVRQQSVSAALDMLRLALTGHDPVGLAR